MAVSLVSLALGAVRFQLVRATYNSLTHQISERWESVDRAGAAPALHWAGHGDEVLTIKGVIYPQLLGTIRFVQLIRAEASRAEPLLMIDGLGFYWGQWVILSVTEDQDHHLADGAPRRQTYQLALQRYQSGGLFG